MSKNNEIKFRCEPDFKKIVEDQAKKKPDRTLSDFAREALREKIDREKVEG